MSDKTKYNLEYLIDTDGQRSADECRMIKKLSASAGAAYSIDMSHSRVLHLDVSGDHAVLDIVNMPENDSVQVIVVLYNNYYTFRTIGFASGIVAGLWVLGQMPIYVQSGKKIILRITSNGTSKDNLVIETLPFQPFATQALTGTTARTWDMDLGLNATMTIGAGTTITMTNLVVGMTGNLRVLCVVTSYQITFAGSGLTFKVSPFVYNHPNGIATTPLANVLDVFSFWYDGTTVFINGTKYYR